MVKQIRDSSFMNSLCADCTLRMEIDNNKSKKNTQETPEVEFVCTSFSVFLCANCASDHRCHGRTDCKAINLFSYFRDGNFNEHDLKALSLSNGNVGFRDFMTPYGVPFSGVEKYKTRAALFYYRRLHMQADGVEVEDKDWVKMNSPPLISNGGE